LDKQINHYLFEVILLFFFSVSSGVSLGVIIVTSVGVPVISSLLSFWSWKCT